MATRLGDVAVGTVVKIKENGTPVDYVVAQQGNPDATFYDSSCNGTWVVRKDIYTTERWGNNSNSSATPVNYSTSTITNSLNTSFLSRIDIRDYIKLVKLPYSWLGIDDNFPVALSAYGANGMQTRVFLLAQGEVQGSYGYDGRWLKLFKDSPNYSYATYNGEYPYTYWYRTVNAETTYAQWNRVRCRYSNGHPSDTQVGYDAACTKSNVGVRPAFILDPDGLMEDDGTVTYNQPPTAPGSITVPVPVAGHTLDITWTAATDTDGTIASYQLERSLNNSGWVQVYNGPNLSYTDTVGGNWGTVNYRVRATDDKGAVGPYATATTQTVQNDILYISGPAPDMGTQPKPFTFTFGVGISGITSITQGITVTASLDGYGIYTGTISTAQQVDLEMDVRTLGPGPHTVRVTANRELSIGAVENYTFTVPATALPPGGYGTQLQDPQGDVVFPQTVAGMVAGLKGKSVAENLAELFAAIESMTSAVQAGLDLYKEDLGNDQ